jgi:hypothetical protein
MSDSALTPSPGGTDIGKTLKDAQTGKLPVGSVEDILQAAPKDLKEEVLEIPEWGYSVEVRSLTAAQSARVKQRGFSFTEGGTDVAWAEMEIMQFLMGVRKPKFTEEQVLDLHNQSGAGFARIIAWIDEHSGIDKKALEESRKEFQESQKPTEV